jgi:5-bromo-4-chloroindolyl phosphate hydrolysis protein
MKTDTDIALIKQDIKYIKESLMEITTQFEEMKKCYVTIEAFTPVKMIAYGLVSTVLITIVGAILTTVIKAR